MGAFRRRIERIVEYQDFIKALNKSYHHYHREVEKMLRKLTVLLLSGVICLVGMTSVLAAEYNEAPALSIEVAAGELPPVEERLPQEPRVIEPLNETGEYGGTLKLSDKAPLGGELRDFKSEHLFKLSSENIVNIIPNVAKGGEFSEDYKSYKLFLREGMKWSDGHPFTADDFVFWYEDYFLNEELQPSEPAWTKQAGDLFKVTKLGDYTVQYTFGAPYPLFVYYLTRDVGEALTWGSYLPKHYLKEFHLKYNSKAKELAVEKGFEEWHQLFNAVANTRNSLLSIGTPTIEPWILKEVATNYAILERNPYYWKIDTAGNQLPYIDKVRVTAISDAEVRLLKIASGEIDFALREMSIGNYPFLLSGEKKGGYKVYLWQETVGAAELIQLNHTTEDLVLGEVIQDVRFKRALSLAINRDEMNQTLYLGLAVPRQATILPSTDYFEPQFAEAYAQYDPEQANKLLDEVISERDSDGFRLRPDGETLLLVAEIKESFAPAWELIKEYWENVGVKVLIQVRDNVSSRRKANKLQVTTQLLDRTTQILYTLEPLYFVPFTNKNSWAQGWFQWYKSDGNKGQEPPAEVKKLFQDYQTMIGSVTDEERIKAGKDILRSQAENLWCIGTVGMVPHPVVVTNSLYNVPEIGYSGYDTWTVGLYEPTQFFLKNE